MIGLLLLGCASSSGWSLDEATRPALTRIDMDGNGRITAPEWGRVASDRARFEDADKDHSGDIDLAELQAHLASAEPGLIEGGGRRVAASPAQGRGGAAGAKQAEPSGDNPQDKPSPAGAGVRAGPTELLLRLLREEVVAVDPSATLPDDATLRRAGEAGLDSPEARAVLTDLRAAASTHGLDFPVGLLE